MLHSLLLGTLPQRTRQSTGPTDTTYIPFMAVQTTARPLGTRGTTRTLAPPRPSTSFHVIDADCSIVGFGATPRSSARLIGSPHGRPSTSSVFCRASTKYHPKGRRLGHGNLPRVSQVDRFSVADSPSSSLRDTTKTVGVWFAKSMSCLTGNRRLSTRRLAVPTCILRPPNLQSSRGAQSCPSINSAASAPAMASPNA